MWSKYVDAMLTAMPIARSGSDQMRNSDQIVTQSAQIGSFLPSHSTPSHLPQFSALGVDLWIRALLQKGAVCARQHKVRRATEPNRSERLSSLHAFTLLCASGWSQKESRSSFFLRTRLYFLDSSFLPQPRHTWELNMDGEMVFW